MDVQEMETILGQAQKKMDILDEVLKDNDSPLRIDKRMRQLSERIAKQQLAAEFEEGKQIKGISWTEERAILPHKCFITNEIIKPGTIAHKGTRMIELLDSLEVTHKKETVWLTKEEFLVRRLKGQI